QITPDQGKFFDGWVHDSYAGFIAKFHEKEENWVSSVFGDIAHSVAEAQGYVRWRGLYQGSDENLNANAPPQPDWDGREKKMA
ncbi:MAG: hypothetical protein LBV61_07160, partial [Burkholderiaceae bacterium]|nr:hypothetical protein [Burkholderiaceae bacterium]